MVVYQNIHTFHLHCQQAFKKYLLGVKKPNQPTSKSPRDESPDNVIYMLKPYVAPERAQTSIYSSLPCYPHISDPVRYLQFSPRETD